MTSHQERSGHVGQMSKVDVLYDLRQVLFPPSGGASQGLKGFLAKVVPFFEDVLRTKFCEGKIISGHRRV